MGIASSRDYPSPLPPQVSEGGRNSLPARGSLKGEGGPPPLGFCRTTIEFCVFDNRGIGKSSVPKDKEHYTTEIMAADAASLMVGGALVAIQSGEV